jgi:hypothetical protein
LTVDETLAGVQVDCGKDTDAVFQLGGQRRRHVASEE